MPDRRPHFFGEEQQVDLENLEAVIVDFVRRCSSKANLVLIGFEVAAEWTYLFTHFPRVIPFFSAWVDLRDIAKDISSSVGVIPGLQSLLQLFGYHWKDIKSTQHRKENTNCGNADNAAADAVATCALADALLLPENQEKLRFRQECGQIARIFTKKKGWQAPDIRHPFIATVRAGGPLPSTLDSGMKLARRFFNFSPLSTGVMSTDVAYLTFRYQDQMNQFVTDLHGVALPTGEILSVQGNFQGHKAAEIEDREREGKQKLREKNRLEKTEEGIEDLGNLFS
ncbi:hypothetical protein F4821DRAFT_240297 [Hypoxylon rubiginosum]|uniref:Uncharacterized protein n=1 Tax=Hypoxylon rubiginosum TaxID=110542 RepID=A0ACC0CYY3_9PEZI|nr:hypothetical protein F4821DRAFT_240297 [Hypoxylon rubiginosum]